MGRHTGITAGDLDALSIVDIHTARTWLDGIHTTIMFANGYGVSVLREPNGASVLYGSNGAYGVELTVYRPDSEDVGEILGMAYSAMRQGAVGWVEGKAELFGLLRQVSAF